MQIYLFAISAAFIISITAILYLRLRRGSRRRNTAFSNLDEIAGLNMQTPGNYTGLKPVHIDKPPDKPVHNGFTHAALINPFMASMLNHTRPYFNTTAIVIRYWK